MGIRLIKRKSEGVGTLPTVLDDLSALYADKVRFKYDGNQNAVVVSKAGRILGSVRAEGALHTVVWAAMSLAEKEA